MNKILLVTKIQLKGMLAIFRTNKRKKNMRGGSEWGAIAFVFGLIFLLMVFYDTMFAVLLKPVGELGLLIPVMFAAATLLILFNNISQINGKLFKFKDYDILMSLPLKTSEIVAGKLISMYIVNMLYALAIMLPAGGVYAFFAAPNVLFYIYFIISLLFVPICAMVVATIVGTLFAFLTAKIKFMKYITILLYIAFFVGIFMLSFTGSSSSTEDAQQIFVSLYAALGKGFPPAMWLKEGVVDGNILYLLLFIAVPLAIAALFSFLISIKFKSINSALNTMSGGKKLKEIKVKSSSQVSMFLKREIAHFFSNTTYIFNNVCGVILLTLFVCIFSFSGNLKNSQFQVASIMAVTIPVLMCFMVGITSTTTSSISLEGKRLWILKSSPINYKSLFTAKVLLNVIIVMPFVIINAAIISIAFKFSVIEIIFIFLMPAMYTLFISLLGLIINLWKPKFNWESETVVIKQSAATLYTMLFSMLFEVVMGILCILSIILFGKIIAYITMGVTTLIIVAAVLWCINFLSRKGEKIFSKLSEND